MRKSIEQEPPAEAALPVASHRIAAIPAAGFCRAGQRWPQAGVDVSRADFDDEQWAALQAEPLLAVVALTDSTPVTP
jgi:hypothetical protein